MESQLVLVVLLIIFTTYVIFIKSDNFEDDDGPEIWTPPAENESTMNSSNSEGTYVDDLVNELDDDIKVSHKEYTKDSDFLASVGAAKTSDNDHYLPAVPYVGLGGYRGSNARVTIGAGARQSNSLMPDQMAALQERQLNGIRWG